MVRVIHSLKRTSARTKALLAEVQETNMPCVSSWKMDELLNIMGFQEIDKCKFSRISVITYYDIIVLIFPDRNTINLKPLIER